MNTEEWVLGRPGDIFQVCDSVFQTPDLPPPPISCHCWQGCPNRCGWGSLAQPPLQTVPGLQLQLRVVDGKLLQSLEVKNPKVLSLSRAGLTRQRQPGNQRGQWGLNTCLPFWLPSWVCSAPKPPCPTVGLSFSPRQPADVSIHLLEACGHACLQSLSFPGEGRHLCKQSVEAPWARWLRSEGGTRPGLQRWCCRGTMRTLFAQLQLSSSSLLHHSRPPPRFSARGAQKALTRFGNPCLSKIQFAGKKMFKDTKMRYFWINRTSLICVCAAVEERRVQGWWCGFPSPRSALSLPGVLKKEASWPFLPTTHSPRSSCW